LEKLSTIFFPHQRGTPLKRFQLMALVEAAKTDVGHARHFLCEGQSLQSLKRLPRRPSRALAWRRGSRCRAYPGGPPLQGECRPVWAEIQPGLRAGQTQLGWVRKRPLSGRRWAAFVSSEAYAGSENCCRAPTVVQDRRPPRVSISGATARQQRRARSA